MVIFTDSSCIGSGLQFFFLHNPAHHILVESGWVTESFKIGFDKAHQATKNNTFANKRNWKSLMNVRGNTLAQKRN